MIRKFFGRLLWIPLGVVLVTFLVANRQAVFISFDPFNPMTPQLATPALPLWVWLSVDLLIGYFLGVTTFWVAGREARARARADRREVRRLQKLLDAAPPPPERPVEKLPVLKAG